MKYYVRTINKATKNNSSYQEGTKRIYFFGKGGELFGNPEHADVYGWKQRRYAEAFAKKISRFKGAAWDMTVEVIEIDD